MSESKLAVPGLPFLIVPCRATLTWVHSHNITSYHTTALLAPPFTAYCKGQPSGRAYELLVASSTTAGLFPSCAPLPWPEPMTPEPPPLAFKPSSAASRCQLTG